MNDFGFFLLKRSPDGTLGAIPSPTDTVSRSGAIRAARKHITASLTAGAQPDELLLIELASEPLAITAANLESVETGSERTGAVQ